MGSWLRQRSYIRVAAKSTPDNLRVGHAGEYRMYSADTSDEDVLAFWRYRYGLDADDPKEIIRFRTHILAGPIERAT